MKSRAVFSERGVQKDGWRSAYRKHIERVVDDAGGVTSTNREADSGLLVDSVPFKALRRGRYRCAPQRDAFEDVSAGCSTHAPD